MVEIVKRFIWQDWLIVGSFALYQVSRFITVAVTTSLQTLTTSANYVEANPIVRSLLGIKYSTVILSIIGFAVIAAYYFSIRKTVIAKPKDELIRMRLNLFVFTIFIFTVVDALNDLSVWVGIFIH